MGADNTFGETNFNPEKSYKIVYWLFFGGRDKVIEENLSQSEARKRCKQLNENNNDSLYSGYNVVPQNEEVI